MICNHLLGVRFPLGAPQKSNSYLSNNPVYIPHGGEMGKLITQLRHPAHLSHSALPVTVIADVRLIGEVAQDIVKVYRASWSYSPIVQGCHGNRGLSLGYY